MKPYILAQHILHCILAVLVAGQFVLPLYVMLRQPANLFLPFLAQKDADRREQGGNHIVEQRVSLYI